MQVSESIPAGPPAAATKDELHSVGDGPEKGARSSSGRRFRSALERWPDDPRWGHDGASAAAMAGWFHHESPVAPAARMPGVAVTPPARAVDRVLVGAGPDGAEARIRIGAGPLAGAEIQLSSGGAGHVVEARLLTHAASSRQTLSVVMDEIRLRLRDRGIVLSTSASRVRPVAPPDADSRADVSAAGSERTGAGR